MLKRIIAVLAIMVMTTSANAYAAEHPAQKTGEGTILIYADAETLLLPDTEGNCTGGNGICYAVLRCPAYVYINGVHLFDGYAHQCTRCYTVYAVESTPLYYMYIGYWTMWPAQELVNLFGTTIYTNWYLYESGRTLVGVDLR